MKRKSTPRREAPRYKVRELEAVDLRNGFLDTLANLSDLEGLGPNEAMGILAAIKRSSSYRVFVAVADDKKVIGATTLLIEQKFIHRGGLVGHIEDVAVRDGYEGNGVGRAVVSKAVETARSLGCYKCILSSNDDVTGFYKKLGFKKHDVGMRLDLRPRSRR